MHPTGMVSCSKIFFNIISTSLVIFTDHTGRLCFHRHLSVHKRGRVSLVPGPVLVPGPMSFLGVEYPWYQVSLGGLLGQGVGYLEMGVGYIQGVGYLGER